MMSDTNASPDTASGMPLTWYCVWFVSFLQVAARLAFALHFVSMSNLFTSGVRLDKWLQVARVFKTRSQATQACMSGRVKVNGAVSKPHRVIKPDDRVEIERDDWPRVLIIQEVRDKPISKAEARQLYTDVTPPRPPLDPLAELLRRPPVSRARGSGRPTKRDRRLIRKFEE